MFNFIVRRSLANRVLVLALIGVLLVYGAFTVKNFRSTFSPT